MVPPRFKLYLLVLAAGFPPGRSLAAPGMEFFEDKVRPLLVEHCYECHSAGHKIKGGLQLDHRAGWETGGDSGPALVPGDPAASRLLRAVSYQDRDLKMPPRQKLPEAAVAILREWIASGAPDPRLEVPGDPANAVPAAAKPGGLPWSFQPLTVAAGDPELPAVKDGAWLRDPVDYHILSALEKEGLGPVEDAAPQAVMRRLFFDLTGLPPSAEDLAEAGSRPFPELVDHLLASDAFAERWAQHWLDLTRFAESSGGGRTLPFKDAWRFRDYVIESIRQDVPLNRMITEHLAGDLLPAADDDERRRQLTATAFLALGPTNYEEQDKGVLRMDIIDEQLETIGRSFMGLTIGCARCHDHKFDPISIRDYYALAGIFGSTQTLRDYTSNVAHWVDLPLPMEPGMAAAIEEKEIRLARLQDELKKVTALAKKNPPATVLTTVRPDKAISTDQLPGIVVDESAATLAGGWKTSTRYPGFIGQGYLHDKDVPKGTATATFVPPIPEAGRYEVRVAYTHAPEREKKVPVHILHADGEEDLTFDQSVVPPIEGRFVSLGTFRFEKDGAGFILISNEGTTGIVTLDAIQLLSERERATLTKNAPEQDGPDHAARLRELQAEIKSLKNTPPFRPETMGVREVPEPVDCRIHIRGNIRNPGEPVPRGAIGGGHFPDMSPIPAGQSGRVQFAEWVTHPGNPLTARVLVNRVWMHLFGEGLVRSVDNFGNSGERPSHPALLDQLAADFMADGWSLRKLVRRLVLTRTWQLASLPSPDPIHAAGQARDPDNRLLGRAHRRRLDAHALRDAILTVSGRLDRRLFGPNVSAGSVDANSSEAQTLEYSYVFTDLRRSLYAPAFRNKRLELFEHFDFADINGPIGQRTRGTIVPQALYFLNHPFILTESRAAAARLSKSKPGASPTEKVDWLWLSILGRTPSGRERGHALTFLHAPEEPGTHSGPETRYAHLIQTLFASADFRYMD